MPYRAAGSYSPGVPGVALFVYGTLLDRVRLEALTGRRLPNRPATLDGFARVQAAHGYPTIVPRPGSRVDGLLLEDVDAASVAALDAYEDAGHLYARRRVEVLAGGRLIVCEAYVSLTP